MLYKILVANKLQNKAKHVKVIGTTAYTKKDFRGNYI